MQVGSLFCGCMRAHAFAYACTYACARVCMCLHVGADTCMRVQQRQLWDGAVGVNGAASPVVLQGLSRARPLAAASTVPGLGCQEGTWRAGGKASALRRAREMLQPSLRRSPLTEAPDRQH